MTTKAAGPELRYVFPSWYRENIDVGEVTPEQLEAWRLETQECERRNQEIAQQMSDAYIGMAVITERTPTIPDAQRGACTVGPIRETSQQLDADLVWWPCSFCGLYVLVAASRKTREVCNCGARRTHGGQAEGWRRGGVTWWFI